MNIEASPPGSLNRKIVSFLISIAEGREEQAQAHLTELLQRESFFKLWDEDLFIVSFAFHRYFSEDRLALIECPVTDVRDTLWSRAELMERYMTNSEINHLFDEVLHRYKRKLSREMRRE